MGSFQRYDVIPSAILSDGLIPIPLWAVTSMTLTETYHLPPIGSSGARAVVGTHDDTISLSGLLIGPERYAWKCGLETLAETSKRGGALRPAQSGSTWRRSQIKPRSGS